MTVEDRVVLCGFMGTGKTTVGRLVATGLKGRFVDLDEVIERRFSMSVAEIFEKHGEGVFREAEREACAKVRELGASVVAVGGGAILDPNNRRSLEAFGLLICLTASETDLVLRLEGERHRPLLQGGSLTPTIRRLLDDRREQYDAIPWQVDTTGRSPDHVYDAILSSIHLRPRLSSLKRIALKTSEGFYETCVGAGLLSVLGELIRESVGSSDRMVVLVTNPMVGSLHGNRALSSLQAAGFDAHCCEIPEGEEHKTLQTVSGLYDRFVEMGLDRHGVVVALGGGVTGDMAGFAAATYLRGVRFVQVPTTLLAMVDASIGGKTGVDLPSGKNLVGAFKQPSLVLVDPDVLATLPESERVGGMSEVIKHGILGDPHLFSRIEREGMGIDEALLCSAIRVKVDIVREDPLELGRRAVLNLGHTFAHGFERASGFRVTHGMAVGVGLRAAARLGWEMGMTEEEGLETRIVRALEICGLPEQLDGLTVTEVREAMATDKKRVGNRLRFVVPRRIGEVVVVEAPDEGAVEAALGAVLR